ncbi:MAG: DUF6460 domain-containing protein [Alphaproteobacteria bacterium]
MLDRGRRRILRLGCHLLIGAIVAIPIWAIMYLLRAAKSWD